MALHACIVKATNDAYTSSSGVRADGILIRNYVRVLFIRQVLLTRVGEFYETYGVDAVMMMQHAGLNKMGQEIRAGCPRKNVQQTLDGLTGAGLTVAIYEEAREDKTNMDPWGSC